MSEYVPFAAKYRPRKLSDMVGQEAFVRTLSNSIKTNRVYPAYLFIGEFGCGKTTAARLLAACLNSPGGETVSPKECEEVEKIFEGKSPDVIEMDGASTRKIDDIRDIKEHVKHYPVESKYKVFIIDEAHALTPEACEALLKTLEEPPEYCKFILCTTESHKIKNTIWSRCQDHVFNRMSWGVIAAHIKSICQKENISIDEDAIKIISKHSEGHVRDALKHLDKVVIFAGSEQKITGEIARQSLGAMDEGLYFSFMDAIVDRKMADGIIVIQKMLTTGKTAHNVVNGMIDFIHTLLVIGTCQSTAGIVVLNEEEKVKYQHYRSKVKLSLLENMIDNLLLIHRGLFYSANPQVLLDQFLLKSISKHYSLMQTE